MVLFCLGLPLDSDFLVHFSRPCEFSLGGVLLGIYKFPIRWDENRGCYFIRGSLFVLISFYIFLLYV